MRKAFRWVYSIIPFKKQLFIIVRSAFSPGEKLYRHLHFKGTFKVHVKKNVSFRMQHYGYQVENDIFWKGLTGRWEKRSIELWMRLSEKASVVLDVGANTGVYALISKSVNPGARVIAVEPVERIFKKLEHNIRLNGFDIENLSIAMSDHNGETLFHDTIAEHTYSASITKKPLQDGHYRPVKVKIATIDTLIKEKNLQRIDLIKIDVEYHEPEVMKGFSMVRKHQPSILIEILSDEIGSRVQREIESHGAPYLYFDIDEEKGLRRVENIRRGSGMNYLLCRESVARDLNLL